MVSSPLHSSMGSRLVMAAFAVFCVGCDQASKRVAAVVLKGTETQSFLGDVLRLTYAENRGAFLGLGGGWPEPVRWLAFTGVALLVVVASLGWIVAQARLRRHQNLAVWAMLLVSAGGVGNLVDRIVRNGHVIDFMNLGLGPVRTGIFNVADVQIMVGLGLLLLARRELSPARSPA
jgi:signal peptidase II